MKDFEVTDTLRISTEKGSYTVQTRQQFDESAITGEGPSGKMKMGKWKTRGYFSQLSGVLQFVFDHLVQESNKELSMAVRDSFLQIRKIEEAIGSVVGLSDPVTVESTVNYRFAVERSSLYSGAGGEKKQSEYATAFASNDLREILVAFVLGSVEASDKPKEMMFSYLEQLSAAVVDLQDRCSTGLHELEVETVL